jgi:hypothetical protein
MPPQAPAPRGGRDPLRLALEVPSRVVLAVAAAGLYLLALGLPAVCVSAPAIDGYRVFSGWECLTLAWELPLPVLAVPAWWANPLFAAGLVCLARGKAVPAGACGAAALLLGLSFYLPELASDFRTDEPVRVGYWAWVGSMLALAGLLLPPLARRLAGVSRSRLPRRTGTAAGGPGRGTPG